MADADAAEVSPARLVATAPAAEDDETLFPIPPNEGSAADRCIRRRRTGDSCGIAAARRAKSSVSSAVGGRPSPHAFRTARRSRSNRAFAASSGARRRSSAMRCCCAT